jgi:hypothetical protein
VGRDSTAGLERHAFEKERWEREYQLQELKLRDQLALQKERLEIEKQSKQDKKAFLKQLLEQSSPCTSATTRTRPPALRPARR